MVGADAPEEDRRVTIPGYERLRFPSAKVAMSVAELIHYDGHFLTSANKDENATGCVAADSQVFPKMDPLENQYFRHQRRFTALRLI